MALDKKIVIAPIFLALAACQSPAPKEESQYSFNHPLVIPQSIQTDPLHEETNYRLENGMIPGIDCDNTSLYNDDMQRAMPCQLML